MGPPLCTMLHTYLEDRCHSHFFAPRTMCFFTSSAKNPVTIPPSQRSLPSWVGGSATHINISVIYPLYISCISVKYPLYIGCISLIYRFFRGGLRPPLISRGNVTNMSPKCHRNITQMTPISSVHVLLILGSRPADRWFTSCLSLAGD